MLEKTFCCRKRSVGKSWCAADMAADQSAGFEQYRRPTKRDVFLETMEQIVPWTQLCEVVEPYYPKG